MIVFSVLFLLPFLVIYSKSDLTFTTKKSPATDMQKYSLSFLRIVVLTWYGFFLIDLAILHPMTLTQTAHLYVDFLNKHYCHAEHHTTFDCRKFSV